MIPNLFANWRKVLYVDDLATGSHSKCDAFHLYQKIKTRMAGGFVLRKCKSKDQELVAVIEKVENSAQQASEDPTYAQTTVGNLMGIGDRILGVSCMGQRKCSNPTYAQTTLGNLMGKGDKILGVFYIGQRK